MSTTAPAPTAPITSLVVARARAEAAEWAAMLDWSDGERARIRTSGESTLRQLVEDSAIAGALADASGLSEAQVQQRLARAARVRRLAPTVWDAFLAGRLDGLRVVCVSAALEQLERSKSHGRLDATVVGFASSHTVSELRSWLRRFVARAEPDLDAARSEQARERRMVEVAHTDDSMAWLNAYLPSHVAAAIDRRLHREARALGADDPRTHAQRRADLLATWATTSDATTASPTIDLAVTIEAEVLAGADGPAVAADGSWTVPADWLLDTTHADDVFFHRMLIDPLTEDVLAHQYLGRFAPAVLTRAITLRDGTCRTPGCLRPADRCDLDHRQPWPAGPTAGHNLQPLCRRHHAHKGHGLGRWRLP